ASVEGAAEHGDRGDAGEDQQPQRDGAGRRRAHRGSGAVEQRPEPDDAGRDRLSAARAAQDQALAELIGKQDKPSNDNAPSDRSHGPPPSPTDFPARSARRAYGFKGRKSS